MPSPAVRISDAANRVVIVLAALLLTVIFGITILAAGYKYTTNTSLTWAIGINQVLLPWVAALSTTVALKYGEHIAMSFLVDRVPARVAALLRHVNYVLVGLLGILLLVYGYEFMLSSDQMIMISSSLQISGRWPAAALPVTGLVYCIHLLAGPQLLATHSIVEELERELTP
ncbi:TRAP transporter small permease [Castellaniella sp.]|uniref:TRAP transporter small permease n=1 Tax=Castellaniella sp. TaxID=1955812 RepID=UPI00355D491C